MTLCFEKHSSANPSTKDPRTKKANPVKSWLFLVLLNCFNYLKSLFIKFYILAESLNRDFLLLWSFAFFKRLLQSSPVSDACGL